MPTPWLLISSFVLLSWNVLSAQPLRQVLINGATVPLDQFPELLYSGDHVAFLWSVDSAAQFRLHPADSTFRPVLPIVIYEDLPEGQYQLEWRGDSLVKPVLLLAFPLEQSLFREWWFAPVVLGYVLLLLLGAVYFIRLTNRRNQRQVNALRLDWTKQLHTDIGSDLSSIGRQIEVLQRKVHRASEAQLQSRLSTTLDVLRDIQQRLRFVFDVVNPNKNTLLVSWNSLLSFARRSITDEGPELVTSEPIEDSPKVRRLGVDRVNKFYLIAKELINNSLKHSRASRLSLQLLERPEGLALTIEDNGVGFDPEAPDRRNGLDLCAEYARAGLMDFRLRAEPGVGTRAELFLPYF